MKKQIIPEFLILFTAFLMVSCSFDVPIRELADAKSAVSNAEKFGAETYAPEELENAKNLIKESHTAVGNEKKEDAVKLAVDAKNAAQAAYEKSLPLITEAAIKNTETIITEAVAANAEEYAPELLKKSNESLEAAKTLYASSDFLAAYKKSDEAGESALIAKSDSLENVPDLEIRLEKIDSEIKRISANRGQSYASEDLRSASDNSDSARSFLADARLKDAIPAIAAAEKAIEQAQILESEYSVKMKTADSIADARESLIQAENALAEEYAPEDYLAASQLIIKSENELNSGNNTQSEKFSAEAKDRAILALTKSLQNKPEFEFQINDLTERYKFLEENDGLTAAPNEMNSASQNISAAGAFLTGNNLKACRNSISAAENDLSTIESGDLRYSSMQKIRTARREYSVLNTPVNMGKFKKDLESAQSLIVKAEEYHASRDYQNTEIAADKALKEIDRIKISIGLTSPDSSMSGSIYTVKYNPGNRDCLWKIAEKVYKRADLWPLIYAANRDKIKDPDLIFPGQKFTIPPVPERKKEDGKNEAKPEKDMIVPENKDNETAPKENNDTDIKNNEINSGLPDSII